MRDFEGQNYINGKWIPIKNEDTYSKINPATGKYLGLFPKSNKDVVHEALSVFGSGWRLLGSLVLCL